LELGEKWNVLTTGFVQAFYTPTIISLTLPRVIAPPVVRHPAANPTADFTRHA